MHVTPPFNSTHACDKTQFYLAVTSLSHDIIYAARKEMCQAKVMLL